MLENYELLNNHSSFNDIVFKYADIDAKIKELEDFLDSNELYKYLEKAKNLNVINTHSIMYDTLESRFNKLKNIYKKNPYILTNFSFTIEEIKELYDLKPENIGSILNANLDVIANDFDFLKNIYTNKVYLTSYKISYNLSDKQFIELIDILLLSNKENIVLEEYTGYNTKYLFNFTYKNIFFAMRERKLDNYIFSQYSWLLKSDELIKMLYNDFKLTLDNIYIFDDLVRCPILLKNSWFSKMFLSDKNIKDENFFKLLLSTIINNIGIYQYLPNKLKTNRKLLHQMKCYRSYILNQCSRNIDLYHTLPDILKNINDFEKIMIKYILSIDSSIEENKQKIINYFENDKIMLSVIAQKPEYVKFITDDFKNDEGFIILLKEIIPCIEEYM